MFKHLFRLVKWFFIFIDLMRWRDKIIKNLSILSMMIEKIWWLRYISYQSIAYYFDL